MSAQSYYTLGRAVARFDPNLRRLTPVCLSNLCNIPDRANVVLRHVWDEMLARVDVAALLREIDFDDFPPSIGDSGSFWIGYYHERGKVS